MAGPNGRSQNGKRKGVRHSWRTITAAEKERFLRAVREGLNRSEAAALVGSTGSRFRLLCYHDPLFEAEFEAALAEGREAIADKLLATLVQMASDPERASGRQNHNALIFYSPGYREAHRSRVELTGAGGGPLEHRMIDPTKLSDEKLAELESLLLEAQPDG